MARAKLSADDQAKLVALYRESEVTASALAEQFGVSNSTVSRILREAIPAADYRRISRQKRSSESSTPTLFEDTAKTDAPEVGPSAVITSEISEIPEVGAPDEAMPAEPALETSVEAAPPEEPEPTALDTPAESSDAVEAAADVATGLTVEAPPELTPAPLRPKPIKRVIEAAPAADDTTLDEDLDEPPAFPPGLDFTPEDDEDEDDEDDTDTDSGDADSPPEEPISVEVQTFEGFEYPDLGYTLIDKYQELVTSPLSALVEQVPPELANVMTLPVFDTHRGARRYSHQVRGKQNKYRVLTFPGTYLEKTRSYLQAKGITHVIMNHQVYEL